ncbi:uncharacterized protein LOC122512613 [Leptopilina heterotoma]|uniref:uncharacterized protein LOC122512613 n=1 Tax=Leptopilina heterotoma TaxID=63436 RepID=UPI001CA7C041|nr:uncharacterized protein LOC122512613 [Leptopilina heterotoma]
MDVGNFTSPLQAVQTIAIFTYLNTLSDFLFVGNFLNETNQYQPIPIVNSLFNYLLDDYQEDRLSQISLQFLDERTKIFAIKNYRKYNYSTVDYNENRTAIIRLRKEFLARKLIEGTDLYGAGENEILDEAFIDALFRHLVATLVFEKYTNIQGFLIEIVRESTNVEIKDLYEQIYRKLAKEVFVAENGYESKLEIFAIRVIIQEFIKPLFPQSTRGSSLESLDYIYASAGSMILHSMTASKLFTNLDFGEVGKLVNDDGDGNIDDGNKTAAGNDATADGNDASADGNDATATGKDASADGHDTAADGHDPAANGHHTAANGHDTAANSDDTAANSDDTDDDDDQEDDDDKFYDYVSMGHTVEQMVIAGKLEKTALAIFTLPALLNHVHNQREILKNETLENIVKNSTLGATAYEELFTYLRSKFQKVEQAKNDDYRLQYQLALMNFKHRTAMAKEMIRTECPFVKESSLDQEVLKYKNNPDDYKCRTASKGKEEVKTLDDINRLYQEQVNKIADRYLTYERESIREIFGSEVIRSVDDSRVRITSGLFRYFVDDFDVYESPLLRDADDMFRFHFKGSGKSVYYAILRKDNDLTIIQEDTTISGCSGSSDDWMTSPNKTANGISTSPNKSAIGVSTSPNKSANGGSTSPNKSATLLKSPKTSIIRCNPKEFRQKLGLLPSQKFQDNYFPNLKKSEDEKFDTFLWRIATRRATNFNNSILNEGYDQTRKEWWKEFGLSLIPFYTCGRGIRNHNYEEAARSCTIDLLFALPLIGEVGYLATKLTTAVTRSVIYSAGTTLGSLTLRTTMREILAKLGSVALTEAEYVTALFTKETFQNLGVSFLRYLDPGFELAFTLGKGGLRAISTVVNKLKGYTKSVGSIQRALEAQATVSKSLLKVDRYLEKDIVVNSYSSKVSGYGYRSLQLQDQVVQFRSIDEYGDVIPVVVNRDRTGLTYRAVNTETGRIKPKVLHLQGENPRNYRQASPQGLGLKSFHDSAKCLNSRLKRSPIQCLRSVLRANRRAVERQAVDYTRQNSLIPSDQVHSRLRKFAFPDTGDFELNFVKDWSKLQKQGKVTLPDWSKQYELADAALFEKLRYSDTVDTSQLTLPEAIERLKTLNPQSDSLSNNADFIRRLFLADKAYESVTLEDYFALREYMGSGYKRIGVDSPEARQMRAAFYRLAIRQSDDPLEEYAKTLFRGETRPADIVEKLFFSGKTELELNRFTSTSTNHYIAYMFQFHGRRRGINIFYEMKFNEPFPRAKVVNIVKSTHESETVLLPGSKFHIDDVKKVSVDGQEGLEVKLTFKHDALKKHEWYKNIMDELEKLKEGVVPYEKDPSDLGDLEYYSDRE